MTADHTSQLPAKRMGAGALFMDESGRLLLVEPNYKTEWEIPGGVVEADESPWACCCREIQEELGLTRRPMRLLCVDWVPPDADRTEGLMLVFDGGVLTEDEIRNIWLPIVELRSYAFCTLEEAAARLSPRMNRRIVECLKASKNGTTVVLEDGRPVLL